MAHGRLPVLFNGDCNFLFATDYGADKDGRYTAKVFHDYVDRLAQSGVEIFVINSGGQVPWQPSKAVASVLEGYERGDRSFVRSHFPPLDETFTQEQLDAITDIHIVMLDRMLDLVEQGVDWVEECVKACRRNGMGAWASYRMNDTHGANNWADSYFNCPPQRDPASRLKGVPMNPAAPAEIESEGTDFAHPATRAYYMAVLRELIDDYDFDGLELDWNRMPFCCNPPATQQGIEMMLDWFADLKQHADSRAAATGKPFPIALRAPGRLENLRTVGIDVFELAKRKLIDIVIPCNHWQMLWDFPVDQYRKKLGEHIAIYGSIEDAPNWLYCSDDSGEKRGYRLLSASEEMIHGAAASLHAAEYDGIEVFNFFCTDVIHVMPNAEVGLAKYAALKGIGDRKMIAAKPKYYGLQGAYGHWMHRFFESADQLPRTIEQGGWTRFELPMLAEPNAMSVTIQLVARDEKPLSRVGVSLNGSWPNFESTTTDKLLQPTGVYTKHLPGRIAMNYSFDADQLVDGRNSICVFHEKDVCLPEQADKQVAVQLLSVEAIVTSKS